MVKQRNPILAATLAGLLGPIGYLYIGWRCALIAVVLLLPLPTACALAGILVPSFTKYLMLPVLAWNAYLSCLIRNAAIQNHDETCGPVNSFAFAGMSTTRVITGQAMALTLALCLELVIGRFATGQSLSGVFTLLVSTPILVGLAGLMFGFLDLGLTAAFAVHLHSRKAASPS